MNTVNVNESLKKLQEIENWFDVQKEVDVELGLQKIKEGSVLIQQSKARLSAIENEFDEVRKSLTA
jgi:hypothetical protein